jgi:hypothetical protein
VWEVSPMVTGTLNYNFTFINQTLESNFNGTHVTAYGLPSTDNLAGSFGVTAGTPFYITIVRPGSTVDISSYTTTLTGWMYIAL